MSNNLGLSQTIVTSIQTVSKCKYLFNICEITSEKVSSVNTNAVIWTERSLKLIY